MRVEAGYADDRARHSRQQVPTVSDELVMFTAFVAVAQIVVGLVLLLVGFSTAVQIIGIVVLVFGLLTALGPVLTWARGERRASRPAGPQPPVH